MIVRKTIYTVLANIPMGFAIFAVIHYKGALIEDSTEILLLAFGLFLTTIYSASTTEKIWRTK